jgi:hypothetical protein
MDGSYIYPYVTKIVLGATSTKPKNYILEIKTSVDGNWEKVFDTLCDSTTTDYFVNTFETPISIVEMRIPLSINRSCSSFSSSSS